MKGVRQFGKELTAIMRNPKVLIPVVVVMLVPVLYSAMFLGAFWDPYAKLQDMPVAVVNVDKGVVYEGKELRLGEEFIGKLKDSEHFSWHFVDEAEAKRGLQNNTYYLAIEIPADFSERTTTLNSDQPVAAEMIYMPNESYNFLAAQIGSTAVEQMRTELSAQVTKAYAQSMFDKLHDLSDGLGQASDGAGSLAAGSESASAGAVQIKDNLNKLASGSTAMQKGLSELLAGGGKLEQGLADLHKGSHALTNGLSQLGVAGGQLSEGADQVSAGATDLAAGLQQSETGASQVAAGAQGLADGLAKLAEANPELAQTESFQNLLAMSKQVAGGAHTVHEGQGKLLAGAKQLDAGATGLSSGLQQYMTQFTEAQAGSAAAAAGADELHTGAVKLNKGLGDLAGGADVFVTGTGKLAAGAERITEGLQALTDGASQLSGKLTEAAEQTSGIQADQGMLDMFAKPIGLDTVKETEVPNYGTGFAPYFLSLGLFVGCLMLTIVFAVREPAGLPSNAWSWFASKTMMMLLIAVLQALALDATLLWGLGLEVASVPQFILFSMLVSVTYMVIIQFFVTAFQNPGRFIVIVMLIMQLTTSAGTFPLELIPSWMQKLNPWLPMTYAVSGMKAIISSGDFSVVQDNASVLAIMAGLFIALTLGCFIVLHRKIYGRSTVQTN